jgi:hypothetical protein
MQTMTEADQSAAPANTDGGTDDQQQGNPQDTLLTTAPTDNQEGDPPPADTEGDKGKDGDDEGKDAGKSEGKAPENYEFKLPEGVTLDEALLSEFTPLAQEMELSQENAQRLIDLHVKAQQGFAEGQNEAWTGMRKGWVETARADPEIGGKAFDATVAGARRALDKYGSTGLKEILAVSGLGDHPELIRAWSKVDKATRDDHMDAGGSGAKGPSDPASILYPNQGKDN